MQDSQGRFFVREGMKKMIVVKIGSSVLLTNRKKLDEFRISHIANQVTALIKAGIGVVLVVSGAVACGHKFVDFSKDKQYFKQAAAGLGQAILTATFTNIFSQKKMQVAQLLLTKDNFYLISKRQKIRDLLKFYIKSNFIAVINENDALDLNSFGGNDHLAGEIATLIDAERLLILSTHEGSQFGIGGGETKQEVVRLMKTRNIKTDILDGKSQDIILNTLL